MKFPSSIVIPGLLAMSLGAAAFLAGPAVSHGTEPHHTVIPADTVTWGEAPASLPPGAQAAALLGSPGTEGPFVIRLKFPAGFVIPPHRHSKDEFVTVISGRVAITSGETVDKASMAPVPTASFIHLPAGMPHYLWAVEETVVPVGRERQALGLPPGTGARKVRDVHGAVEPRARGLARFKPLADA